MASILKRQRRERTFGKSQRAERAQEAGTPQDVVADYDAFAGYGWVHQYLIATRMPEGPKKKAIRGMLREEKASCFWHAVLDVLYPEDAEWFFKNLYPRGTLVADQAQQPVDIVMATQLAERFELARHHSFGMVLVDLSRDPYKPDFEYAERRGYTFDRNSKGIAVVNFNDHYELAPHWVAFARATARVWQKPIKTLHEGINLRSIADPEPIETACHALCLEHEETECRAEIEASAGQELKGILCSEDDARWGLSSGGHWTVVEAQVPNFTLGRAQHLCPVEKGYVEHVGVLAPTNSQVDYWQWNARLAGWKGMICRAIYGAVVSQSDDFMSFINGSEAIEATEACLIGANVRSGTWIYSRETESVLYDKRRNADGAWRVDHISELVGRNGKIWLGEVHKIEVRGVTFLVRPLHLKRTWISALRLHQDVIRSIVPQVVDASFHAGSNAIRDPEAFCRYTLQVGTLLMKDHPEFVGPYRDLGAAVLAGAKDKKREELDMIPLGREVVRTAEALKAAGALAGAALPK